MILKFQQGGRNLPPLVSYQPVMLNRNTPQLVETTLNSDKNKDLTDKDLLNMMEKLEGLPNDIELIHRQLQNFYIDTPEIGGSFDTSNLTLKYLNILSLIKIANFNRKEYDKAYNAANSNKSINELAINDRGLFYCVNSEGDFKLMSIDELKLDNGYVPLTNSELLLLRAFRSDMANKNDILSIVQNSTSMDKIHTKITSIVDSLGTGENLEEGYINKLPGSSRKVIRGLLDFKKALLESSEVLQGNPSIYDLYKYKYLTKDLALYSEFAINYIFNSLTENEKALLRTKVSDNSVEGAKKLVSNLVASLLDSTKQFLIDLISGPTKDQDKDKAKNSSEALKNSFVISVLAGMGAHDGIFRLDPGNNTGMVVNGSIFEEIKKINGDHLDAASMKETLDNSGLRSIIDGSKGLYFGNLRINLTDLDKIQYDDTGLIRTTLPINNLGEPNFKILDEYSKAMAEYETSNKTDEDRKRIFHSDKYPNLSHLINEDGSLNKQYLGSFILLNGITTNSLIDIDEENKFLKEMPYDEGIIANLKLALAQGEGKSTIYPDIDEKRWFNSLGNFNPVNWVNDWDDIYKGVLFIPINMNKNAAALGSNLKLLIEERNNLEGEYLRSDKTFIQPNISLLNN